MFDPIHPVQGELNPIKMIQEFYLQQECIPVGCVPSAAEAVCGVSARGRGCLPGGGVSASEGVCPGRVGSARGGGVCPGGLPVNRITGEKTLPFRNFVCGQ